MSAGHLDAVRRAITIAGTYALVGGLYILVSSRLAASLTPTIGDLALVETIKGLLFIAVTSLLVFVTSWRSLRAQAEAAASLARQRAALVSAERMALAGVTAAAVAHDANNLLTALIGEVEAARDAHDPAALDEAHATATKLIQLHRQLARAGVAQEGAASRCDVSEAAHRIAHTMRLHPALHGCAISVFAPAPAHVLASTVSLDQVLTNLIVNAGDATDRHGRVEIRVTTTPDTVRLEVHDDGPGVPVERRATLFTALTTTKAHGTGLGLYSARACAQAAHGQIGVDDSPLGGACFWVTWPRAS